MRPPLRPPPSPHAQQRLHAQRLTGKKFETPAAVVSWLGAVQAQDHAGARWAVAQRLEGGTEAGVEGAFAAGALLRTHVLRPTWHFVTPADLRWMLELTAPRVRAAMGSQCRKLGVDDDLVQRSQTALRRALEGGLQLTRVGAAQVLARAGIDATDGLRLGLLLMHAELAAVVCSGAMQGKQHTYALVEDRAPPARARTRDEALAELTRRYFTSHGPATLPDFSWWSGLSLVDVKRGVESVKGALVRETVGEDTFFSADPPPPEEAGRTAFLLPNYDELLVAYTDRSASLGDVPADKLDARGSVLFNHTVVIDGRVVGTWKRVGAKRVATVAVTLFRPLSHPESRLVADAAARYGSFVGLPVQLSGIE